MKKFSPQEYISDGDPVGEGSIGYVSPLLQPLLYDRDRDEVNIPDGTLMVCKLRERATDAHIVQVWGGLEKIKLPFARVYQVMQLGAYPHGKDHVFYIRRNSAFPLVVHFCYRRGQFLVGGNGLASCDEHSLIWNPDCYFFFANDQPVPDLFTRPV